MHPLVATTITLASGWTTVWTETLSSTATPAAFTPVSTTLGTAAESTVLAPTITTKTTEKTAVAPPGSPTKTTLSDIATVTGLAPGQTGVVKVILLGLIAATSACDTSAAWNGAPTLKTQTVQVTGGTGPVSVASQPVDITSLASTGKRCWTFADTLSVAGYRPISAVAGTRTETVSRNTGTNGNSGDTAQPSPMQTGSSGTASGAWLQAV